MREIVFFDIDGTLFNPERFGALIREKFVKILNISEEELIRANADYYAELVSSSDFNPGGITEFLASRFAGDKSLLDKVFWEDEAIYKDSLFEETIEVLEKLYREKTLGIFSQGNEELQSRKLEASGIKKFFSEEYTFIHDRKLTDSTIELLPRGSKVVDDNHEVVIALVSLVTPIWMNRRTEDNDPEIKTIHNLRELIS